MQNDKPDRAAEALQQVLEIFGRDDAPQVIAHTLIKALASDKPSARWSLCNQLIMLANETDDARGFRQWKEAGRTVKKGAKAFFILGPRKRKVEDRETGEDKMIVTGFVGIPVFRYEDTEGEPLPEHVGYEPPALPPLYDVAAALGVRVDYAPLGKHEGCYGYFVPGRGRIVLGTHSAIVFFHELAHAAHERVLGSLKGGQQVDQEVIAETVAATLAVLYDVDTSSLGWSRQYVSWYGKGDAARTAVRHLSMIEKVLRLILETEAAVQPDRVAVAA